MFVTKHSQSSCWVIKIGSALLTNDGEGLDTHALALWVDQIAQLRQHGIDCVLVSSGAIAEGMVRLKWPRKPTAIHNLQAAAAVGQMGLIQCYEKYFAKHQLLTAQILLTHEDLANRQRYLNSRSTFKTLLQNQVIPIVNENDTIATDEIRFGDNDNLAALVANLVEANRLIILTDQDGLFDKDPRHHQEANHLPQVKVTNPILEAIAKPTGGALGSGGMYTKVQAARLAARSGTYTIVANGRTPNILSRLNQGEALGTLFIPSDEPIAARKQWLAGHMRAKGEIWLDDGAIDVLVNQGKSLLSIGVIQSCGDYNRGDMVSIKNAQGHIIGRGLINYSAVETQKIKGQPSKKTTQLLGYTHEPELIHRDNLVLL